MERPVKGDVVVLPFPFSDLSASKRRPALVIATLNTHNDVILCMITSKSTYDTSAVTITGADFVHGGLSHDSNVRPNRLFTADATLIQRIAGHLAQDKLTAVIDEVIRILRYPTK